MAYVREVGLSGGGGLIWGAVGLSWVRWAKP